MTVGFFVLLSAVRDSLVTTTRHGRRSDRGSVTLEQIAITAGLVALALGVVAAIGIAIFQLLDAWLNRGARKPFAALSKSAVNLRRTSKVPERM